jgi:phosphate transport system substrate-binding protein
MQTLKTTSVALAVVLGLGAATTAQARDQIRIVGSSTVYPFASYVVEEFGATTKHPTPVIESTGSGGGLKLFCEGTGASTPDVTNASRRMKPSEFDRCQENGVTKITEAKIGADGIVIAQDARDSDLALTREQLLMAVAKKVPRDGELVANPYENWSQIDASLPDREIEIYGPPATSGTRDAFEELVMGAASKGMSGYEGHYTTIRGDGVYIPSGENDNLIVKKIQQNTDALGIFGYSFLDENRDKIDPASIDGFEPTSENISAGDYPVSRSLWFYIKNAHVGTIPGIKDYVSMFMSDLMIGGDGLLKGQGLIPLPASERAEWRNNVKNLKPMKRSVLE